MTTKNAADTTQDGEMLRCMVKRGNTVCDETAPGVRRFNPETRELYDTVVSINPKGPGQYARLSVEEAHRLAARGVVFLPGEEPSDYAAQMAELYNRANNPSNIGHNTMVQQAQGPRY